LDTESPDEDAFDQRDLELFGAFADQAAVAIHNAKLFSDLEKANERLKNNITEVSRLNKELETYAAQIGEANIALEAQIRQLTTLHEAGQTITASLNLDDTLSAILRMTQEIVESSSGAIRLLDEETKELKIRAKAGIVHEGSGPYFKYDLPLKIGQKTIGVFELIHTATQEMDEGDKQMLETLASQAAIAIENARLFEDTQRIYYETLKSLAKALEARDDYTRGHSERVADFSLAVAKELNLPDEECNIIYNSALLHDIGKIGVRDEVLLKPRRLTESEMEIIRKHPTYGKAILGPLKFLGEVSELVKYHHERWDGSGYPTGLKREDIPLASRIIGVADAYDAMTSTRPYRKALSHEQAIAEITKQNDVQFDPKIVEAFLKIINERVG
jgi:putative nucleotidyltransferase with HDIG domain